jgi:hypothetical protein
VQCYFDPAGYIAEVVYRNSFTPYTGVSLCFLSNDQLQKLDPYAAQVSLSATEVITKLTAYSDSGGVRSLVFTTNQHNEYSCGSSRAGRYLTATGGGFYPLAGFLGSCRRTADPPALTRLTGINSACWNPNYHPPTIPTSKWSEAAAAVKARPHTAAAADIASALRTMVTPASAAAAAAALTAHQQH